MDALLFYEQIFWSFLPQTPSTLEHAGNHSNTRVLFNRGARTRSEYTMLVRGASLCGVTLPLDEFAFRVENHDAKDRGRFVTMTRGDRDKNLFGHTNEWHQP